MRKNLTEKERNLLAQFLLQGSKGGKLERGVAAAAAVKFSICKKTVYLNWAEAMIQRAQGLPIHVTSKKVGKSRNTKLVFDPEMMKLIPYRKRGTVRGLGNAIGVSKTVVGRWKKSGVIRAHTNAIKPKLTPVNMFSRLNFCVVALKFDGNIQKTIFQSMSHIIHMDEKWFNMTECMERVYIALGEPEPYRACQSKKFIVKVMFNCAVSRPLYTEDGELIFDGKIGIWPYTKQEQAQRKSKNRARGTWETKAIDSVNKDVTREMLINHVIPAIHAKWPANASKNIIIQWDNAPPHIKNDDPAFRAAASTNGFNINLMFQPPNSPDLNINDLGWFRSLQSLKAETQPNSVDEMVREVTNSFTNLSHVTLNKVFLSLQGCMIKIMNVRGHNNYGLPHQKKDKLIRLGLLPTNLEVEVDLVKQCVEYLKEAEHINGLETLMADLGM